MGIIHYLFIAGQEDENAYLPVAHKNAVSHPVTIWTMKDKLTQIPEVATNFARSVSLTIILVPNCLLLID